MNTKIYGRLILSCIFALQSGCSFLQSTEKKVNQDALADKESIALYSNYSEPKVQPKKTAPAAAPNARQVKIRPEALYYQSGAAGGAGSIDMHSAAKLSASAGALMGSAAGAGGVFHVPSNESYDAIPESKVYDAKKEPLSTFSIDVDTASYSNMRPFIEMGFAPPKDAIRIEEMMNYFSYDYEAPAKGPFSVNLETVQAPWDQSKKIVRIGIKGQDIKIDKRPASNLVFLVDVSGSMAQPEKLPLVQKALNMLVENLNSKDRISIVTYAGSAGVVLQPTSGSAQAEISAAIDRLSAGGGTNGAGGIEMAYKLATENFIEGGVNRVIMATDGDFNVGTTSRDGLLQLVQKNAKKNIYLSILGFGMGNYKDGMMETLSNKGNGNYAYIDNQTEARKVLVEQMSGTLITIAKDVKIQVEFNPLLVESYRLIGYENRVMNHQDFNNDKKDAGDIGAGHTVTALYEITPVGVGLKLGSSVDALKYGKTEVKTEVKDMTAATGELLTVKMRYKKPDGNESKKIEVVLNNVDKKFQDASASTRFATAVAMFGMKLRESEHTQDVKIEDISVIAKSAQGEDKGGYKAEFLKLIEKHQQNMKKVKISSYDEIE